MKLRLRAVEPHDAALFYEAENDMEAWDDSLAPFSMHLLRDYAENYRADPLAEGQLRMIIEDCETGQAVGILDFYDISFIHGRAFVGIYILRRFRRQGYAERALVIGADYARRRLGLRMLGAKILLGHQASLDLFSKAGYEKGGILPKWYIRDGEPADLLLTYLFLE